jgi:hypothetical protein
VNARQTIEHRTFFDGTKEYGRSRKLARFELQAMPGPGEPSPDEAEVLRFIERRAIPADAWGVRHARAWMRRN